MDERERKKVKKHCPVCNSTRAIIGPTHFVCKKCGYINDGIRG